MPHDHGDHGHDSCGHGHQHSQGPDLGIQYSLYSKIDLDNVQCLNEEVEGSGKLVFKPWELRLELDKVTHHRARSFRFVGRFVDMASRR